MSIQVSGAPLSKMGKPEVIRRSANFPPSVWGDYFLKYASNFMESNVKMEQKIQNLKEEVKKMLVDANTKLCEKLSLIDAVQRLGLFYHFEGEIDKLLHEMEKGHLDFNGGVDNDHDLYMVALRFRLLRQEGYRASCDVFRKYMDDQGKFKESLIADLQGMLSLYEAAHLGINGEEVLDEALVFTTTKLKFMAPNLSPEHAQQVERTLRQPIRKNLVRLDALESMSIYQRDPLHSETLLTFAKMDFNSLQKIHQKELSDITLWWKDLDFSNKLPFARDRLVECYFWILAVYFEPKYVVARIFMTKVIAMTSVIDDIYDVYGTLEELVLFTDAIERWDMSSLDKLPDYMQLCYKALLDVYTEIETKIAPEGKSYRLHYAKEAMKDLVKAYLEEAKWLHQQYTPTMEEYMSVALVTTASPMLVTASLVGMGDVVTKDVLEWIQRKPKMLTSSSIIIRLMDDIKDHKFEQEIGHVATAIECYMTQYGATEEETIDEFQKAISMAWKDINEECLRSFAVPLPILTRILNLTRGMDVLYKDGDGYTFANIHMKEFVASMLVHPVQI